MLRDLKEVELGFKERKLLENGWGYAVAKNVITQKFFYKSDNVDIKGYLSHPKDFKNALPIIIWNRGGNNKSGLLDDFLASGILGEIASWGYVVFASQYREKDEFGGRDIYDVLNLLEEAKRFELADKNNIGMEGWSRGGMMSYLTLAKSKEIKCCIIVAGLSDLIRNGKYNPKLSDVYRGCFGNVDEIEFDKRIKQRSAICWFEKICSKTNILFIHGTADDKVLVDDTKDIYNKLSGININTNYEMKLIDGGDHYLRKDRKKVSEIRKEWFDSNLKFEN